MYLSPWKSNQPTSHISEIPNQIGYTLTYLASSESGVRAETEKRPY